MLYGLRRSPNEEEVLFLGWQVLHARQRIL